MRHVLAPFKASIVAFIFLITAPSWLCADGPMYDNVEAKYKKAIETAKSGDIETAATMFKKVIELDSKYHGAHRQMAVYYRMTGKGNEAVSEMKAAVALAPDNPSYRLELGRFCVEQQRWEEAVEQLNELRDMDFNIAKQFEADILMVRGQKLKLDHISKDGTSVMLPAESNSTEDKTKAIRLLQEANGLLKDVNKDSSAKAKRLMEEAIALDSENNMYHLFLARLYANEGDYESAKTALESFLSRHPEDAQVLYMLAGTYLALKMYNEAVTTYEKIKDIDGVIYSISRYWIQKAKESL